MKRHFFIPKIAAVVLFLLSNSLLGTGQNLKIAVAANAQFAAQELKKAFEKQHRCKMDLIVSSSGKLTVQIAHGAPYDLFLSADMKFPLSLYRSGQALEKPRVYALGKLVLWTFKNMNLKNLSSLESTSVKTIAVANPETAPYGAAAIDALKRGKVYDKIKSKIVYGESIAQVNQYLLSDVADVAFTAKSVVESPKLKIKGKWVELSSDLYPPIKQGAALLKYAQKNNLPLAQAFYQFLFSKRGKNILKSFGYSIK